MIELGGGVGVADLQQRAREPLPASWLEAVLWRMSRSPHAVLERLDEQPQPTYDLTKLIHPHVALGELPPAHFLGTDSYQPRTFTTARVANTVITRHAKAVGAAGVGLIEQFNVSGSAGVPETLLNTDLSRLADGRRVAISSMVERVPGLSVPIGHYGFETFGHFVLDALLQVYLFEDALQFGAARLVHWPLANSWMDDLLTRCGAPLHRRRVLSKPVALLQRAELSSALAGHGVYFPSHYSLGFFEWLKAKLAVPPAAQGKLYVRRPDVYQRRILNQTSLEGLLTSQGFEILDPSTASIPNQASAFSGAELVVSPWGSGLTLAPLMRGTRTVIELLPASVTDPWFVRQAAVHELSYNPIFHPSNADGDIVADLPSLQRVLAHIGG